MAIKFRWLMALALLSIFGNLARGNLVGLPVSLETLGQQADIIFKGTVVSSKAVNHDGLAFGSFTGFITQDTEFNLISTIKGEVAGILWYSDITTLILSPLVPS